MILYLLLSFCCFLSFLNLIFLIFLSNSLFKVLIETRNLETRAIKNQPRRKVEGQPESGLLDPSPTATYDIRFRSEPEN
jgi:hypothetical protein